MSVTITKGPSDRRLVGSEFHRRTEVTLDSSYAEGGESLTAKQLGLRIVHRANCVVKKGSDAEATAVGSVSYDEEAAKLIVNDYKTQKPMAAAKDLSKVVVVVDAYGS